ncbi:hypothetical protein PR202_ga05484 [Eleusine coracana subsp. coracana]|uniref:NADH dehydrogenase [ubiquinone] 1 alpha subcomplex subunit 1 n=1 Tax=Eleusine coracana subsp. coracana TaxID=191504 RepID=A0AAV5BRE5_ELECO|nr:hypothetical protein PR202_ga05031 [Eleusine coracana subsp. coracana]GJM89306.1 hypothetical protein PR202_ga05484 [Eleusine coracana subsp. coracana]
MSHHLSRSPQPRSEIQSFSTPSSPTRFAVFSGFPPMARLQWLEAMLPLGIIGGMLCIMGNAQYYIHRAAHGRPKHIGNDMWDVAMERRDKKLVEQTSGN